MFRNPGTFHSAGVPDVAYDNYSPRITDVSSMASSRSCLIQSQWSHTRAKVAEVIKKDSFDAIMVVVVLANMVLVVIETDAGVQGRKPAWIVALAYAFLCIYICELSLRLYVDRAEYFHSKLNCFDATIVLTDAVFQVAIDSLIGSIPSISVLRVLRVIRLMRVIRVLRGFRELWLMLHGFAAAMKAMFWACVLVFMLLLMWSVVAVEILHPISQEIVREGGYPERCLRCSRSFETTMDSMISWFLLIFTGELWEDLAVPIIENSRLASIVFVAAFVCINFGMLNLILSVIVDRASEARADDQHQRLLEKRTEFKHAAAKLRQMCDDMDTDQSGCLSLEELARGYDENEEFATVMRVMDVARGDIDMVFHILDEDKSGHVTPNEFVDQLYRMKSQEAHTLLVFIKHYIMDVRKMVTEELKIIKHEFEHRSEQSSREHRASIQSLQNSLQMKLMRGLTACTLATDIDIVTEEDEHADISSSSCTSPSHQIGSQCGSETKSHESMTLKSRVPDDIVDLLRVDSDEKIASLFESAESHQVLPNESLCKQLPESSSASPQAPPPKEPSALDVPAHTTEACRTVAAEGSKLDDDDDEKTIILDSEEPIFRDMACDSSAEDYRSKLLTSTPSEANGVANAKRLDLPGQPSQSSSFRECDTSGIPSHLT